MSEKGMLRQPGESIKIPQMSWSLHYSEWMIGDGEPHRSVGEVFNWFAIEFWSNRSLTRTSAGTRLAIPCGDYQYRVAAEVVFIIEKKAAIIDFGLMAIGHITHFPADVRLGDFLTGEISIGLPLCIELIPNDLIEKMGRQWRVDGISADLTPYRDGMRDATQVAYREINTTDEIVATDYVLHCEEVGPSTLPYPPP